MYALVLPSQSLTRFLVLVGDSCLRGASCLPWLPRGGDVETAVGEPLRTSAMHLYLKVHLRLLAISCAAPTISARLSGILITPPLLLLLLLLCLQGLIHLAACTDNQEGMSAVNTSSAHVKGGAGQSMAGDVIVLRSSLWWHISALIMPLFHSNASVGVYRRFFFEFTPLGVPGWDPCLRARTVLYGALRQYDGTRRIAEAVSPCS